MDFKKAIADIFDGVGNITQVGVARLAKVQRTQLNTYIRQGGTLPADSIARVVKVLLMELDRAGEETGRNYRIDFKEQVFVLDEFLSQQESRTLPLKSFITSANYVHEIKKGGESRGRVKREDLGKLWPWIENILEIKVPVPKWYEDLVAVHITGVEGSIVDIRWSAEKGLSILTGERILGPMLVALTKTIPGVTWCLKPSDDNFSRMDLSEKL